MYIYTHMCSILRRMGFVKRRVSTTAKISVANFEEVKAQFLLDIKVSVEMDEIPPALVINLDQTGIHYVPAGSWTMDKAVTFCPHSSFTKVQHIAAYLP